jgi:hypothetical protein
MRIFQNRATEWIGLISTMMGLGPRTLGEYSTLSTPAATAAGLVL